MFSWLKIIHFRKVYCGFNISLDGIHLFVKTISDEHYVDTSTNQILGTSH